MIEDPTQNHCGITENQGAHQFELTRYLSDNWVPVIEKDVDGPNSLPLRIDGEVPNLGKYAACRRVARTVYLGSAPTATAANRGLEDRRIKLGCVMAGESPSIFGDALRRLATSATYLYQDGNRYWYSTQPTVTKMAEDRAEQYKRDPDALSQEVESRLRADLKKNSGDFKRVHPLPSSGQDVPDDRDARLVVLGIDYPFNKERANPAITAAKAILESRGNTPRLFRNTLMFLAVDQTRLQDLEESVCRCLAWESILREKETLDLSPHQVKQAETQRASANSAVNARLPEAYQWMLVPVQAMPQSEIEWQSFRLAGQDSLAVRASKKLRNDELLVTSLAGTVLRKHLDDVPLWRGDHVSIRQLVEDFARYLYLPRLTSSEVLLGAIKTGLTLLTWHETFAYADSFDNSAKRYRGLRSAQRVNIDEGNSGLIVRPEAAQRQVDADRPAPSEASGAAPADRAGALATAQGTLPGTGPAAAAQARPRRFHGSIDLDPTRVGRDAGRVADEVIAHIAGQVGAKVKVTLEIHAELPDGAPDNVVRTVTENSRTLKFKDHGFEES